MPKLSNELKITIMIVAALVVAFFGYRIMKDMPLFRQSNILYSHFANVNGLNTGNYIYINGVKVGSVKQMKLEQNDSVRVSLSFNLGIEIPKGSVAEIQSSGLLGNKSIVIKRSNNSKEIPYGGTIKGVNQPGAMDVLKSKGKELSENASQSFDRLNDLLGQLNKALNDTSTQDVHHILANLQQVSGQTAILMKHKRRDLEKSISHIESIMATLDTVSTNNKAQLDSAITGLNHSMNHLQDLTNGLQQTNTQLNGILTKINNGQGTLGKMVNDPSVYNHIDSLSTQLTKLLQGINRNPDRYLKNLHLIDIF